MAIAPTDFDRKISKILSFKMPWITNSPPLPPGLYDLPTALSKRSCDDFVHRINFSSSLLSFLLLATQNTNVENICGTEGAKAKGRKEYCRDRCLTVDGLGIELYSASVLV